MPKCFLKRYREQRKKQRRVERVLDDCSNTSDSETDELRRNASNPRNLSDTPDHEIKQQIHQDNESGKGEKMVPDNKELRERLTEYPCRTYTYLLSHTPDLCLVGFEPINVPFR